MSLKRINFDSVMDSLFREFLSQPGERQHCSEILHAISKGELEYRPKDFLKIPNGLTCKSSPKSSPVGSPMNVALLSPIFLPPSPRSPAVCSPSVSNCKLSNKSSKFVMPVVNNVSYLPNKSHSNELHPSVQIHSRSDYNNKIDVPQCESNFSSTSLSKPFTNNNTFRNGKLDINFNPSKESLRISAKGQAFSSVFNEAMGLSATPTTSNRPISRKNIRKWETIPSPPSPPRQQLEALPSSAPTITANTSKQSHLREPITSIANKENARPTHCASSHVSSTPTTIHNHPTSQSALSSTHNATSPLGLGVHVGLGSSPPSLSTNNRTASRRLTKTPKNLLIPRFYYPMGRPHQSQEEALECVSQCFRDQGGQISRENMEPLMRVCDIPLYWKAPLFIAAGGEKLGYLTQEQFSDYWERVISTCHDVSSRFVRVLSRGLRNYLLPEDFLSLIQDVVDTHPGLTFLKEATEFHSRYVHTVIARIYYCVNRSWSGKITIPEIRRSNLLQVISYLEEEEDINKITDYFSYEHFYVIYCKFWELDTDHDLFIDRNDLAKHNERALSDKIIDRIFSGAVTRGRVQKQDRMGYQEFVWFLISEEDKRHPTAIEYWFRCMDIDGDGFLSMYELEYFYEDQLQRMEALGIETLPYTDCLCQMLDMVRPSVPGKISLSDLKKCRMTTVFFDTFFNFDKYLDHEQRDPFASHRMDDDGPEISDWDRYAAEEYELLVAEEGGGDPQDDMLYGDEDELSMGVDNALDADGLLGPEFGVMGKDLSGMGIGGSLNKHSSLSATVPNLAIDHMDVDEDYSDYADSDDYQY